MTKLPFGKRNYQLMIAGVFVLVFGFTLMAIDKETYGFGLLGLTIGPMVVLAGFGIQIFAILYTPRSK